MNAININITIGLKEETIDVLKRIAAASIFSSRKQEDMEQVLSEGEETKAEEETAPAVEASPAVQEEPEEDLPEDTPEVTADMLAEMTRAAVKALKEKGKDPQIIRKDIFSKYGITESRKCAPEHRNALYNDLNAIANA